MVTFAGTEHNNTNNCDALNIKQKKIKCTMSMRIKLYCTNQKHKIMLSYEINIYTELPTPNENKEEYF